MKILIAPDKFKGSLTSRQACDAIMSGLSMKLPHASHNPFPLADGGDGTAGILTYHAGGRLVSVAARDPLMRPIEACYGLSPDGKTAFIEMADASGLRLLTPAETDVMKATTAGTGDLIKDAIEHGVTTIILGIGGSATNDGATGAAAVLGYGFLDAADCQFLPAGESLARIVRIQTTGVHPNLRNANFIAVCDVDNPLTGKNGAAAVYAPQKGASPEQVLQLDSGLSHLSDLILSQFNVDIRNVPGAGGGGGFGGGAIAFFRARLRPGIEVVFEYTGFEEQVRNADIIITGEGKMDEQTLRGKVVAGVTALAEKHSKPVIGIAGINTLTARQQKKLNLKEVFSLTDNATVETAMKNAFELLEEVAEKEVAPFVRRLWQDAGN